MGCVVGIKWVVGWGGLWLTGCPVTPFYPDSKQQAGL